MSTDEDAYARAYRHSLEDPESFWLAAAEAVSWDVPPTRALDDSHPPMYRWFPDCRLNTSYNARPARRSRQRRANSSCPPSRLHRRHADLLSRPARAGRALRRGAPRPRRGLRRPGHHLHAEIPEAIVAMLACARLGAVHSVVFGGFAARELAVRINHAAPKAIMLASCGIEASREIEYKPIIDAALDLSTHAPGRVVVFQREQAIAQLTPDRDVDWQLPCRWPNRPDRSASRQPTRCTSSTRPERPAGRQPAPLSTHDQAAVRRAPLASARSNSAALCDTPKTPTSSVNK